MNRQPGTGTRWTNRERAERPGSTFHELVTLPTLAPHLARPEYVNPNAPFIPLPQARSRQEEDGVVGVFSSDPAPESSTPATADENDDANDDEVEVIPCAYPSWTIIHNLTYRLPTARQFTTSILSEETIINQPASRRSNTKVSTSIKSVTSPGPTVPLLNLSRCAVIEDVILETINGKQVYAASPTFGPTFFIMWKGLALVYTFYFSLMTL